MPTDRTSIFKLFIMEVNCASAQHISIAMYVKQ